MMKIIVVEDEELVRKGIVLTVDWAAIQCMVVGEASNGKEGLRLIQRHSPDLVITDVKMPQMDGVEMIRQLRRDHALQRTEFIILTAHSDFTYAHSALKLGVADYLLKPFKDGQLEEAILSIQRKNKKKASLQGQGGPLLRFDIEKGDKSKYVEEAIRYIRQHYSDPALGISTVAGYLGISEGYLSRIFKKETDYTFVSYLTHYRIHVAMNLLKNLQVKVYEVSEQVGYLDTTYFSTLFKKLIGISPSEYQDRCL